MTFETVGRHIDSGIVKAISAIIGFAYVIIQNVASRSVEQKKRDEISILLELQDSQLRDMGISRDDVRNVLMKPLDFKSGRYLENIRRNNRISD